MTGVLYVVVYAAALVFAIACAVRFVMYARTPIHLRWELYPVPHEDPERVRHGGSYFEDGDWWTKPRTRNLAGEVRFMATEILFLKALFEHNRSLWLRSFPFHFGLYLLIGAGGAVLLAALLGIAAPALLAGAVGVAFHWLYTVMATAGMGLAILGALGLLHRRLTDPALKVYTTPGDVWNLIFFVGAFGLLAAGLFLRGPGGPGVLAFAKGLLTFDTTVHMPLLVTAGLLACAILTAYIPMTHMAHFIGKYFTYHSVRWNDAPNMRGGAIEKKLAEYLTYRPTWAAPHMGADGTRTWADVATTNPAQGGKK